MFTIYIWVSFTCKQIYCGLHLKQMYRPVTNLVEIWTSIEVFFALMEESGQKSSEGQTSTRLAGNKPIRYFSRSFLNDKLFLKITLLVVRLSINVKMCCKMKIKHNLPLIFVQQRIITSILHHCKMLDLNEELTCHLTIIYSLPKFSSSFLQARKPR